LPRFGWSEEKVAGALSLSLTGQLQGIVPLFDQVTKGKKTFEAPRRMEVPVHTAVAAGVHAFPLCHNAKYLLGLCDVSKEEADLEKAMATDGSQQNLEKIQGQIAKDKARTLLCFQASKELHEKLLKSSSSPEAKAILAFFASWHPGEVPEYLLKQLGKDQMTYNLVFWVDGKPVLDNPEICRLCDDYTQAHASEEKKLCLVTGNVAPVARLHGKIKGIKGAQSSGASLVAFNSLSFESYGHVNDQGLNAPVSEYASFAYTTMLNYFLTQDKYHMQKGDAAYVFWSESTSKKNICEDIFKAALDDQTDEGELLQDVMTKIAEGNPVSQDIDLHTNFHIMCLVPNNARISVRLYYKNTFGALLEALYAHYRRMEIVRPTYQTWQYVPLYFLLRETVRPGSKDTAPSVLSSSLLSAILTGGTYPEALFEQIMLRVRANTGRNKVTPDQAAIIKGFLLRNRSNQISKEELSVSLNTESKNVPYCLGRVFSVLEQIQESANPGIKATIKDRYFNGACATPAVIFPLLMKLSNAHLKKLDDRQRIFFNRSLQEILANIDAFPTRLTLTDQGMFVLGYYHQTQKRFEKKNTEEEEKEV
jgi:CRISPR-associated protein Csd1